MILIIVSDMEADANLVSAIMTWAKSDPIGPGPAAFTRWLESREQDGSISDATVWFTWVLRDDAVFNAPNCLEWQGLAQISVERSLALEAGEKPTASEMEALVGEWVRGVLDDDADGDYSAMVHVLRDKSGAQALLLFRVSGGAWGTVDYEIEGAFEDWGHLIAHLDREGFHNLVVPGDH